jgi:hypothetical protein
MKFITHRKCLVFERDVFVLHCLYSDKQFDTLCIKVGKLLDLSFATLCTEVGKLLDLSFATLCIAVGKLLDLSLYLTGV